MPDQPEPAIELSTGEPWRGLKPGMPRADTLRVLEAAGAKTEDDDTDPGWVLATAEEWGMEMRFTEDGVQALRQIVLDDWECVWAGQEIANRPLHEALAVLGDAASGASWREEDAVNMPFDDLEPAGEGPFTDVDLLREGTLWLPQRGLGLVMCDGAVNEIVWRRPEDVPTQFVGTVTEEQKQITKRPDLAEHLRKQWLQHRKSVQTASANPIQRILTLLLVVALGTIAWRGWKETQLWQAARVLPGNLVSVEKATKKPWRDRFVIKYSDPTGRPQTATLQSGDFYVSPREIGEEVQLRYAAGDPPRVAGPREASDMAFVRFVPWGIGAGAIYLVLWSAAGFAWRLKCAAARSKPPAPPAKPASPSPFTPDRGR